MEKYEMNDTSSELEKEIRETIQKLKELSFGEKIVLYNVDVVDPPPDGTLTDIYRLDDRDVSMQKNEQGAQSAWYVGFDDELVYVKFGSEPKTQDDFNGSIKISKCRCKF